MKLQFLTNVGKFLRRYTIVGFSGRAQLHEVNVIPRMNMIIRICSASSINYWRCKEKCNVVSVID
jgi:hypothetical protein